MMRMIINNVVIEGGAPVAAASSLPSPGSKTCIAALCCHFASSIGMATGVLWKYFGRKNETLPQLTISCGLSENVQICSRNKQHHCCLCVCVCVCLYPLVTVPLSGDDPQTRPRSRRNSLNSFPWNRWWIIGFPNDPKTNFSSESNICGIYISPSYQIVIAYYRVD